VRQPVEDTLPEPVRKERSHLEFPAAIWTSFDRYSRYGAISRAVRSSLGPGKIDVLDVGDTTGYLSVFDPDLRSIGIDLVLEPEHLAGAGRIVGDGCRLPFADGRFDAVVTSDTLEHVPQESREDFLAEVARVSRDVVVIAAPFDTPGVAGAEELVRRFILLATGRPQVQLEEHREHGLPGLDATAERLQSSGYRVRTAGNGNLHDWVTMMVIKHQLSARPALGPLEGGYDVLYNSLFAGREGVGPFYRHLVAGRRDDDPQLGTDVGLIEGTPLDISAILAVCAAGNVAEAVRQDTVPKLDGLDRHTVEMQAKLVELQSKLEDVQVQVAALRDIDAKLDSLLDLLRHPVRRVGAAARRRIFE
jgi:SAM-dependent methyltransferase